MVFNILYNKNKNIKQNIKEFLLINLGILLVAVGIHFFKNPNRFALGGISGLSVVLSYFFPKLPIGSLMMGLNIILLLLGYAILGKDFGTKSIYGSFALSGMVWLLEIVMPVTEPLTQQKFLELMYGVFLPGVGISVVFHYGATTGGTDVIAKIISKYTGLKISMALLVIDFIIAFSAGLVFGITILLFSVFGICLKAFVVDSFLENLQVFKIVVIISDKSQSIKDFICHKLVRGATVHIAKGAFTVKEREVITTVLSRKQALRLQIFVAEHDPDAFITISNSSKIIGNGFGRFE